MNNIQNAVWSPAAKPANQESAAPKLVDIARGNDDKNEKDADGSKTIVERSTVTASDGSQMLVLTQVTVSATGQRSNAKVIGKYKIGKPGEKAPLAAKQPETSKKPEAEAGQGTAGSALKNTAGKEYEQNSLTSPIDSGTMLKETI